MIPTELSSLELGGPWSHLALFQLEGVLTQAQGGGPPRIAGAHQLLRGCLLSECLLPHWAHLGPELWPPEPWECRDTVRHLLESH